MITKVDLLKISFYDDYIVYTLVIFCIRGRGPTVSNKCTVSLQPSHSPINNKYHFDIGLHLKLSTRSCVANWWL